MTQSDTVSKTPILKEGALLTLKGGIWSRGEAFLTTERFYRRVRGSALLSFSLGVVGALINQAFPWRTDIDIPLASITVIGRGRMGLKKDVIHIETAESKKYDLTPNYDFWFSGLKDALQQQGATLAQTADETWSVQR
jgi:hypothetical protein